MNDLPELIDSHAHLDFKDFDAEPFGPIERHVYGAPGARKGTIGGVVGGVAGAGRDFADNDSAN